MGVSSVSRMLKPFLRATTHVTDLIQDIGRSVLRQALRVVFNSIVKVPLLIIRAANASQGFGHKFIVCPDLSMMSVLI